MANPDHGWIFEWRRGWDALQDAVLNDEWRALAGQSPDTGIFQEPLLVKAWFETRGRDFRVEPVLLWARHANGSRVLIPFCAWPVSIANGWRRRLVPAGEPHFDYQDPLAAGPAGKEVDWVSFWPAAREEIRSNRGFELAGLMRLSAGVAPGDSTEDLAAASPIISLGNWAGYGEYVAGLAASQRGDLRRQMNKLSERGTVECVVFGPHEVAAAQGELGRMQVAYGAEWAGTPAAGLFCSPAMNRFYSRMIADLLPAGWLHFSVMRVGGQPVSWHFGFLHRGVFHYYKPVYDPRYASYSPGKQHCLMLIGKGFEEGWTRFDFGAGVEGYKLRWTQERVGLRQVWWWTRSLRSRLCFLAGKLTGRGM